MKNRVLAFRLLAQGPYWGLIICLMTQIIAQTGCVTGTVLLPILPVSLPLIIYGSAYETRSPQTVDLGLFMGIQNPGYDPAFNQIPVTSQNCENMGVSAEEIENYNDNVNIQAILKRLRAHVEKIDQHFKRQGYLNLAAHFSDLNQDPELKSVANEYGFDHAAHLIQVFQQNQFSRADLDRIANSQEISAADVKILLSVAIATKLHFEK